MLLDRIEEREALDRLLDAVRSGESGTLVLQGEPGIGKTALVNYAAGAAGDLRVLRLTGVESELGLDFAGLHQLLLPVLSRLDRLPPPQERALGSALGLSEGPTPDRFLVGLAVLTLLADVAAERKLLILIDDAQWLDEETAAVLAFVARRLHAEGIGLVFTVRDDIGDRVSLEGLPALQVEGLPEAAAYELMQSLAGGRIDERVGERIVAATRANPLALVELSGELSATELAGAEVLPEPLPIGSRLEERYGRRILSLPADTQLLMLLAAADPAGDTHVLWRAAAELGIPADAAEAAEDEGLLVLFPSVRFSHPLVRSAVYAGASPADRRRVHAALAAATDSDTDADRRAWHRATAAIGPDEEVAAELERAAAGARRRGGYAASAAFLERAAALTPDARRRGERLLGAAAAEVTRGAPGKAAELLDDANPRLRDPMGRARALRLRGDIDFARGNAAEAARAYLFAGRALEPLDERLACETLLWALASATVAGLSGTDEGVLEVAEAARALLARSSRDPTVAELLLAGFAARVTAPYAEAVPPLRRAVAMLGDGDVGDDVLIQLLGLGWVGASELLEEEARDAFARRWVRMAREQGALTRLSQALTVLGISEAWAGRLDASDACFAERREINEAIGFSGVRGWNSPHQVIVLAWRGREAEARALANAVLLEAMERRHADNIDFVRYALAVLDVGLGRYDSARDCALRVFEKDPPYVGIRVLPELVEAAVRTGDRKAAANALDRLSERAHSIGTSWALGLLARCRAQLVDDSEAEPLYRKAIEQLAGSLLAPELARAHLLYGEWLRRQRRRRDARAELRIAHEMFERMGGEAFAERARTELLATGARARKRTDETRDELTQQEKRVAQLAAEGATNAEIAAQLFISPSTVQYHLRKVFRNLGVRSRTQLARMFLRDEQAHGRSTSPVR